MWGGRRETLQTLQNFSLFTLKSSLRSLRSWRKIPWAIVERLETQIWPVKKEEGNAEAEPYADEGQLLDFAGQQVIDHFKAWNQEFCSWNGDFWAGTITSRCIC